MYQVLLKNYNDKDKAYHLLRTKGAFDISELIDENEISLFFNCSNVSEFEESPLFSKIIKIDDNISWDAQWSDNKSSDYGVFDFEIEKNCHLKMQSGPGFGDLTHPTTKLMIDMMKGNMKSKSILDLGSGSGVLTLSSILLGASIAIGIDIEKEAVMHAKENATLNGLANKAVFYHSFEIGDISKDFKPNMLLINMISSEQKNALKSIEGAEFEFQNIIASGVLKKEKDAYLEFALSLGWRLEDIYNEGEWLGFKFCRVNY